MGYTVVYRELTQVVSKITGVSCDPCGKKGELILGDLPMGFHSTQFSGGWGDTFLGDTETIRIVVCDECLQKWVKSFVNQDVSEGSSAGLWDTPYTATHSETHEVMVVHGCWLYPEGGSSPKGAWNPPQLPDDYPEGGIWEHFKGRRYEVIDLAWDTTTQVPHVIYRALYEESKVWARPLPEWFTEMDRDGYKGLRFKRISEPAEQPIPVVKRVHDPLDDG